MAGAVSPRDVPGLSGDRFACYAFEEKALVVLEPGGSKPFELSERQFELFWLAPIERGFAALGLTGKLNGPGAVRRASFEGAAVSIELRDTGEFLAWCEQKPRSVTARDGGRALGFVYDAASRALRVAIASAEDRAFTVAW